MANDARVRSVEALESLRASLITFLSRAKRAVDMVSEEVARTRQWVQVEQRMFWTEQLRKRTRALERAEQEYFSARLSSLKQTMTMQEQQLRKAKAAVAEATEKLQNVKKWMRDFDRYTEPLVKKVDTMRGFLDHVMPRAIHYLDTTQRILSDYAEINLPVDVASAPPPETAAPQEG